MKKSVYLFLIIITAALSANLLQAEEWQKFTSREYGFSVETPGVMTQDQAEPTPEGEAASINFSASPVSETDSVAAYKVIFVEVQVSDEDLKSPEYVKEFLNSMRDSYVQNSGATLIKEERFTLDGYPAQDIVAKGEEDIFLMTRFVITNKGVVSALIVSYSKDQTYSNTAKFFKSLKILK